MAISSAKPGRTDERQAADETQVGRAVDKLTGARAAPAPVPRPAFHKIIVGHDGTPSSAPALAWAKRLAELHRASVLVVGVAQMPDAPPVESIALTWWPDVVLQHDEIVTSLREATERAAAELQAAGVQASARVVDGSPSHEIPRIAKAEGADLIVVGAKRTGALSRVLLGSTAEAILGRVNTSVLVARVPPDNGAIVAAADGSSASSRATALGLRLASASGARLVVDHVLDFPEDAAEPTEGLLRDIVSKMQLETPPRVSYVLDAGRPANAIVARAQKEHAGLIVMGARGLGSVAGLLLGSVSHRVANTSDASVLVVREASG